MPQQDVQDCQHAIKRYDPASCLTLQASVGLQLCSSSQRLLQSTGTAFPKTSQTACRASHWFRGKSAVRTQTKLPTLASTNVNPTDRASFIGQGAFAIKPSYHRVQADSPLLSARPRASTLPPQPEQSPSGLMLHRRWLPEKPCCGPQDSQTLRRCQ